MNDPILTKRIPTAPWGDPSKRHVVHYDEASGSVQSFLESQIDQRVKIRDLDFEVALAAGERIHTEDSHKYGPDEIEDLAKSAGLTAEEQIRDAAGRFAVSLFVRD